jgi:excinuclease ABC subunit C
LKKKISLLENFKARSTVVNPDIDNVDVFAIVNDDKYAYVNYLKIVQGAIVQSHTLELKKGLEESLDELLIVAAFELRKRFNSQSKEMYFPFSPKLQIPEVNVFVPQRGDKKKLIALSEKNARQFMIDRHRMQEKLDPDRRADRILSTLQKDLNMDSLPKHIECFDNSNLQGSFPVSACVVFKNAKPSKKEYRHFNIKTVVGPNDFASMEEVVQRRYRRLLEEGEPLPQLIIIDGGKGQLSASVKSLERLGILDQIMIIGIAKRLEEIFIPTESVPLYIDKRSESLKLIQNLRNEAHRFGITHHRSKRKKANLSSQLLDIDGIGKNTAESLLRQFKSLKRVKEASKEDLAAIVGQKRAKAILDFYTVEKDKT